ncbi:putative ribonuclease H-like domain-containing protein [Tanacetum coccineum]
MAREAELKKQRVFNTGNGVAKPVWNNANRVNRANHFVPRPVQLNAVRSNVNTGRANVNTVRANVNSVRQNVNSVRTNINTVRSKQPVPTNNTNSFSPVRPQVNKFNQRSHFSKSHSPVRRPIVRNTARMTYSHAVKGNWGTADHPLKNMEDRGIFDSGCSGHMTGNKDHLDDFEECKGGSVTFGGSKGYITGKGRIRVGGRFSWVFFLATKDETSGILQNFIRQIKNQLNHRVKIIRSDNGTEFKNRDMLEFCGNKGIKQEYSNARTPQQNGVAERMNRTLIEAARTMLADSLLPTTFWAEAVSTACYIFNRNQTNPHAGTSEVTKIHIDNESTICIVKNLVYHSKTKHIEIRHHFIRDSYEKKLIRVEKIHTDFNVADLLTKAFDGPRFNFLVVHIGMINP